MKATITKAALTIKVSFMLVTLSVADVAVSDMIVYTVDDQYEYHMDYMTKQTPEPVPLDAVSELIVPGEGALECVAQAVYFEARGEGVVGQMAVANVIINRLISPDFPNTVCEVVQQQEQFSYYWDGKPEKITNQDAWETALIVAEVALEYKVPDDFIGVTYYHTVDVNPRWSRHFKRLGLIGSHIFYRSI